MNRLHRHVRDPIPGGGPSHLTAVEAAALLGKVHPCDAVEIERKQIARELLSDIRRLDKAIAENRRRCATAVAVSGTSLTKNIGISDMLAAKILGHIGDVNRFPSADHLASYADTTAIESSLGDVVRHRLSRHGRADHVPRPLRDYYERRLATGRSRTEALRALKRQITEAIYRTLLANALTRPSAAAA